MKKNTEGFSNDKLFVNVLRLFRFSFFIRQFVICYIYPCADLIWLIDNKYSLKLEYSDKSTLTNCLTVKNEIMLIVGCNLTITLP